MTIKEKLILWKEKIKEKWYLFKTIRQLLFLKITWPIHKFIRKHCGFFYCVLLCIYMVFISYLIERFLYWWVFYIPKMWRHPRNKKAPLRWKLRTFIWPHIEYFNDGFYWGFVKIMPIVASIDWLYRKHLILLEKYEAEAKEKNISFEFYINFTLYKTTKQLFSKSKNGSFN